MNNKRKMKKKKKKRWDLIPYCLVGAGLSDLLISENVRKRSCRTSNWVKRSPAA
jgi:hypothetical protein